LTASLGWSWIFFINLPVGILLFAVAPWLLRESRAALDHRHFDALGAGSITAGLMLLVYALTRATQAGWGTASTIGLLIGSGALIASFFAIELRSKAPLLPLRLFRLRTLAAANATQLLVAAALFSQFFLLTLYMQQVLHYSAMQTGVAYIAFTLAIILVSNVAQALVTRVGVRRILPVGLTLVAVSLLMNAQLPVDGHYFWNIFPQFLIGGIGLALTFVPLVIGGLTGVRQSDAGVASGLFTTSQQVGGAIGVAVATTISTTLTAHYLESHPGATALTPGALTYGFSIAFYVLAGLAALGAVVAAVFIQDKPAVEVREAVAEVELAEAA
jgi:predicted MFS family arabinose efflux permease